MVNPAPHTRFLTVPRNAEGDYRPDPNADRFPKFDL
jgi:hypothetical protein